MAEAGFTQELTTWIQIALNIITIVVLVYTWRAAAAQAKAAKSQADASEKLIQVTNAQRLAAERSVEASKDQSALIKAQLEESLRPILVYQEGPGISSNMSCTVINQGKGAALDVTWWYGWAGIHPRFDQPISSNMIGSDHSAQIVVNQDQVRTEQLTIQYRSTDGRQYQTFVSFNNGCLLQLQRVVIPSSL